MADKPPWELYGKSPSIPVENGGDIKPWEQFQQPPLETKQPSGGPTMGGELKKGFAAGKERVGALVSDALVGQFKDLIGDDAAAKEQFKSYQEKIQKIAEKYPTAVSTFGDVDSLKRFGLFSARLLGEGIPSIGASLAGGLAGLVATGGNPIGGAAGLLTTSYLLNTPESYVGLLEQEGVENAAEFALGIGALKSGLDFIPAGRLFSKTFGKAGGDVLTSKLLSKAGLTEAAKKVGSQAGEQFVLEGITEAMQEAIDVAAENVLSTAPEGFFTKENIHRMAIAGYAGALTGGAVGVVGGGIQVAKRAEEPSEGVIPPDLEEELAIEEVIIAPAPVAPTITTPKMADEVLSDLDISDIYKGLPNEFRVKAANYELSKGLIPPKIPNLRAQLLSTASTQPVTFNNDMLESVITPADLAETSTKLFGQPKKIEPEPIPRSIATPEFKAWFGASKVVTPEGLPQVVYHGTKADIEEFKISKGTRATLGEGVYFTTDPEKASYFAFGGRPIDADIEILGANVIPAYIKLENPATSADFERVEQSTEALKKEGFDGVISDTGPEIVVFDPKQIKSTMNKGAFDPDSPKISEQRYKDPLGSPKEMENTPLWDLSEGTLRGMNYKVPETPKGLKSLEERIAQEVAAVAGPNVKTTILKDLNSLRTDKHPVPIRGAQVGNAIYIGLQLNIDQDLNPFETALHETWHYLYDERMGLFTDAEREIIEQSYPEMVKSLENKYGVLEQDIRMLYDTGPEGRMEVVATLFGNYAVDPRRNKVPTGLKGIFQKGVNFLKRLGKSFNTKGIRTFEDVFDKTLEGTMAPTEAIEAITNDIQVTRLQKISDTIWEDNRKDLDDANWESLFEDAIKEAQIAKEKYTLKDKFSYTRSWFATAAHQAHKDPLMSAAAAIRQEWESYTARLMTEFGNAGKDYVSERDMGTRIKANEIIDHLRTTDQNLELDPSGSLTYIRGGNIVRVSNPDIVKVVQSLDAMYKAPLVESASLIRESLGQKIEGGEVLTIPTLEKRIKEGLDDPKISKANKEILKDAKFEVEMLKQFENMGNKAYFPHYRFGPYGTVVHSTDSYNPNGTLKADAEPLYYSQIEEGRHLGKYNKFQYDKLQSDLAEFRKMDNVVISDIFETTRDSLFNNLPDSVLTFELLSQLLGNVKDPDEYAKIMKKMKDKISTRGFAKRFTESRNIPGYSTDYIRVADTYVSSAAQYLGNTKYQPLMTSYMGKLQSFGDSKKSKAMTDNALKYIDYINSPDQEFQKFVTFNFLWTMGMNVSSAAIQPIGLYTFTQGNLAQYNPNVLENLWTITKNWRKVWRGLEKSKAFEFRKGALILRFDRLQKEINLPEDEIIALEEFYKSIHSGEQFLEESLGRTRIETRSLDGQRMDLWDVTKNFLGIPMSLMEQITRAVSFLSAYQTFKNKPSAVKAAHRVLKNDKKFINTRRVSNRPLIADLANFVVDESHAVFGKRGRGRVFRGPGRIILPFTQFVTSMNEMMLRMASRGPEGRRALAVTMGSIFLLAGAIGLPGAELLKELIEEVYRLAKGKNIDLEIELRGLVKDTTGSTKLAIAATQGFPRAYTPLDIAPRIRQQIAGQDLLLALMGVRGGLEEFAGVQGTVLSNFIAAMQGIREGESIPKVAGMMSPSALGNLFRTADYATSGVSTRKGIRLISPKEIRENPEEIFLRLVGFGTSRIASAREEQYWSQTLNQKYRPKMNMLRSRAQKFALRIIEAQKKGDIEEADKWRAEYKKTFRELMKFIKTNKLAYDTSSFQRAVYDKVGRNLAGRPRVKDYDRIVRREARKIRELSGRETN